MRPPNSDKFYFIPVKRGQKTIESSNVPKAWIGRNGTLGLNSTARQTWFQGDYVRLFVDEQKKVIGLKPVEKANQQEMKELKKISKNGTISANTVFKLFHLDGMLIKDIPLELYEDDIYGKLVYFTVPKSPKQKHEPRTGTDSGTDQGEGTGVSDQNN